MLDDFKNIQDIFKNSDKSIHKARNELKIIKLHSHKCAVKSFKVPHLINKFAYTFFRDSKAKKSYANSIILKKLHVETPEAIGIIEFFDKGLLAQSYFISICEPYDFTIREVLLHQIDNHEEIIKQFTRFTFDIHKKNVWHVDYSPGNILISKKDKSNYKFSLVDVNRMSFKQINTQLGCTNFAKLWTDEQDGKTIAQEYAKLSKIETNEAYSLLKESRNEVQKFKNKKQKLKDLKKNLFPSRKK